MDTPFVREYTEDRELTAWFLLDLSPSVDFGTADMDRRKRTVLIDFVTTLSRLLTRRGNRVGAVLDSGGVRHTIPAGSGRVQVLRIADALLREPRRSAAPFTDLAPLLDAGHQAIKRRSLVFVISDFISEPGWERSLDLLDRRHEVMAVRLVDPREVTLPDVGPIILEDAETGEQLYVDTGDPGFRRRFEAAAEDREAAIGEAFRRAGVDAVSLSTDEDLVRAIVRMAALRRRRRRVVMTFVWPQALLLLVLIPLGLLAYRAIDRRQRRKVAAFGGSGAFGSVTPAERPATTSGDTGRRGRYGRHDHRRPVAASRRPDPAARPRVLLVAGFTVMVIALARPQGRIDVPRNEGTVILAFDISGSMAATDLQPTRMAAAIAAATDFVQRQPPSVVIGVVAFSDSGIAVQQPTNDPATVLAAIGRLTPQRGTSLGRGIEASLTAIEAAAAGPNVDYYSNRSPEPTPVPTPVPAGTHLPAVIVLLTDGENNERPDPMVSAQAAADRGVRIYTVGIGSPGGATLDLDGFQVHTQLDAESLKGIADLTGGTYYAAEDAATLDSVYQHLDTALVVRPEDIELTAVLAGAGLALLLAGAVASLAWLGRLP